MLDVCVYLSSPDVLLPGSSFWINLLGLTLTLIFTERSEIQDVCFWIFHSVLSKTCNFKTSFYSIPNLMPVSLCSKIHRFQRIEMR